jgi:glycosyltransferase involved in cell wall biosynthesis
MYFPRSATENVDSLMQGLGEFEPDVVNCHSVYGKLPYGTLAKISTRYPTCFTVHDPRPVGSIETACWSCTHNDWCLRCPLIDGNIRKITGNRYFRSRLRKRLTHHWCAKDMVLVCPSRWMANRLREQELSKFRTVHIPNGINVDHFKILPANRARFGLPEKGTILLHLAWHAGQRAINERKGLPILGDAFINHVAPRYPDTYLAVAGESFAPNHPNVRALGMVDPKDLPALFASVDIFVMPTLADNLPYTILEAMACGKPVVASAVGGIPEQVEDGKTGFLIPPGDAIGIGGAISRFIQQPELVERFGSAGRAVVEKDYSMPRFLESCETLFEELVEGRRKRVDGQSRDLSQVPVN